jgi:DNA transposition AAA+ family ATPase
MTLSNALRANNLTMGQAARLLDVDKSMISKVCSHTYHLWEQKETELVTRLAERGYDKSITDFLTVNTDVLVKTRSASAFFDLCDDLLEPDSTLSSSIGMAIGTAERGKTHAARWYCAENESAVYTLYVDGFSRVQLLRNICAALSGVRPYSFGSCVATIAEVSKVSRRLIIIDEADKCPIALLEMLRGINEMCGVPIVLVGEENLKAKIDSVPRLRSRIRNPVCVFDSVTPVDVAVYYSSACGIALDKVLAENLSKRASGGFRTVVNHSLALAKIARASGLATVTPAMLDQLA